jgi:hypothetical protein
MQAWIVMLKLCPTPNEPPNWSPKIALAGVFLPLSIVNLINLTTRVLHPPSYGLLMHLQQDVDPALLNDILGS